MCSDRSLKSDSLTYLLLHVGNFIRASFSLVGNDRTCMVGLWEGLTELIRETHMERGLQNSVHCGQCLLLLPIVIVLMNPRVRTALSRMGWGEHINPPCFWVRKLRPRQGIQLSQAPTVSLLQGQCAIPGLCSLRHVSCYSKRNSLIPKAKFLSATAAFVNQLCKGEYNVHGSCSSWAGVDSQHGKSL